MIILLVPWVRYCWESPVSESSENLSPPSGQSNWSSSLGSFQMMSHLNLPSHLLAFSQSAVCLFSNLFCYKVYRTRVIKQRQEGNVTLSFSGTFLRAAPFSDLQKPPAPSRQVASFLLFFCSQWNLKSYWWACSLIDLIERCGGALLCYNMHLLRKEKWEVVCGKLLRQTGRVYTDFRVQTLHCQSAWERAQRKSSVWK